MFEVQAFATRIGDNRSAMDPLFTPRLELRPVTMPVVIAVLEGRRRSDIEALIGAEMPWAWPSRALLEQVFSASLEEIRANPETRLWGDRLMITREGPPRCIGSVVFHGRPDDDGCCEIGYGVDEASQRQGFASEAMNAVLPWALAQPTCRAVRATTTSWHKPSARLLEKVGMKVLAKKMVETEHGAEEMLVYEIRRP